MTTAAAPAPPRDLEPGTVSFLAAIDAAVRGTPTADEVPHTSGTAREQAPASLLLLLREGREQLAG
ncbi:hypothetical protein [Streptomyces sp. NPDC057582]|uniref:hypothetical protein n=1 Tax=Streptomyces sp. NPDC057582 TaxID=3346174 RepID=UPI00368A8289